jgi:hypothetical protein
MKNHETYWDNFNTELYALVRQVKKHNLVRPSGSSFQDASVIYLN